MGLNSSAQVSAVSSLGSQPLIVNVTTLVAKFGVKPLNSKISLSAHISNKYLKPACSSSLSWIMLILHENGPHNYIQ